MSQTFCSLLLFFTSSSSSSWTLLSSQEPLDPEAGTLASGVLLVCFWHWVSLSCLVRTACSYFICRHQMDTIGVDTQLHMLFSEPYPWSYWDGNVTLFLISCWHAFKHAPLCRGVKTFLLHRWRYICSRSMLHMVWGLCVKMLQLFTEGE